MTGREQAMLAFIEEHYGSLLQALDSMAERCAAHAAALTDTPQLATTARQGAEAWAATAAHLRALYTQEDPPDEH